MKIEKRGNSYRIQSMYKGKRYSITFDHKPSQKEITLALAAKYENNGDKRQSGSVKNFAEKYIENRKKKDLSPTTLSAYSSIIHNSPEWFIEMPLYDVTEKDVQKAVDEYSADHSPKSTSNLNGFYASVFSDYRPSFTYKVKLPKKVKKMQYEPSTDDVRRLINAAKGTRYSVFIQLASHGVRRGEIGALDIKDLSDENVLTINKDMVKEKNNQYVIKDVPKTSASNRRILIPASLANEIRNQGYIYKGNINMPNKYIHTELSRLGIPSFNLHILRHFAAAYLNKLGFSREQIIEYMGWEKGSNVMERVYSYNLDPEERQKDIATAFEGLY